MVVCILRAQLVSTKMRTTMTGPRRDDVNSRLY